MIQHTYLGTGERVRVCMCAHVLHVLVAITHNVTANQFYKQRIHKSLSIY